MFRANLKDLEEGDYLALGVVSRAFGLKGEVRVHLYNPNSYSLPYLKRVLLKNKEGRKISLGLRTARPQGQFWVLLFESVDSRDKAEQLRGMEVLARKDELPPLGAGEYYWFQLLGLTVRERRGSKSGKVVAIEESSSEQPKNVVLVVEVEGEEFLVPLGTRLELSLDKGEIIVESLEDFR